GSGSWPDLGPEARSVARAADARAYARCDPRDRRPADRRRRGPGAATARGRAELRRRIRQAAPGDGRARPLAGPALERARLQPGEDRERSERGRQAADGDRFDPPRADVHRRALRAELPPHPRARLELRLLVELGLDRLHDHPPTRVLPLAGLDRRRPYAPTRAATAAEARSSRAARQAARHFFHLSQSPLATVSPCPISSVRTAGNDRSTMIARKA